MVIRTGGGAESMVTVEMALEIAGKANAGNCQQFPPPVLQFHARKWKSRGSDPGAATAKDPWLPASKISTAPSLARDQ